MHAVYYDWLHFLFPTKHEDKTFGCHGEQTTQAMASRAALFALSVLSLNLEKSNPAKCVANVDCVPGKQSQ